VSISNPNWIAVSDRLPDAELTVLVACPQESEPVWLGYLGDEDLWLSVDGAEIEVTHWAELPAPPTTPKKKDGAHDSH